MREARRLSLEEAAERAGLSRSYLEKLEYGTRAIGLEASMKLAELYQVTPEAIHRAQAIARRQGKRQA